MHSFFRSGRFGLLFLLFLSLAHAQHRPQLYGDWAVGVGPDLFSSALSIHRMHPLGQKGRWQLGYGLRLTGAFVGSGAEFTTAPAELTSGETGPHVIFLADKEENLDTLTLTDPAQFYSLNLAFYAAYRLAGKWQIGLNIDLVGVTWGSRASGTFRSQLRPGPSTVEGGVPNTLNALLISDNDYGSLNSELTLRYQLNDRLGLRAGFGFLFSELTLDRKVVLDNDRFRLKSTQGILALQYRLSGE